MDYYTVTTMDGNVIEAKAPITLVKVNYDEGVYDLYSGAEYVGSVRQDFVASYILHNTETDTKGA